MNVLEVYEEVKTAVERARNEKIRTLLEARTYRYLGHSMSDPATYRTKEEVDSYRKQDPILILQERMLEAGIVPESAVKELDGQCKAKAEEAVKFAEESEAPAVETLWEDVLVRKCNMQN